MRTTRYLLIPVLLLFWLPAAKSQEFFFKPSDRVVMIGDSITEQHLYSNYVEMWVVTRFPKWDLTFRNVGIGGDTSRGGNSRFNRDVVSNKPTAMTVDFGMNDGGYRAFEENGFKAYMGGLEGMAKQAAAANIRSAWVTPQPLDTGDQGATALTNYNLTLEKYSEGVKTTAEKYHGVFVDQFHPYLSVLDKARAAGPKYDRITSGDAVHPGPPGQALMAASILKGLHFPKTVAKVFIYASAASLASCENTKVSNLKKEGEVIKFDQLDEALPFFPEDARSILKWTPILEDLNDYNLKVTGLKAGKYEIKLGGKKVAEVTADALATGVNLADAILKSGPIADQVKAVRKAVEAKNREYHDRIFRGIILAGGVPDWLGIPAEEVETRRKAAIEKRMAKVVELDGEVRKTLEIKPHTVEISPIQ
jgi:lysophospholipase L1-like esterase